MEFTRVVKATNVCVPSPSGHWIAALSPNKLAIRSTSTLKHKRVIAFNSDYGNRIQFIRWSPKVNDGHTRADGLGKRRSGIDKNEEEGGATPRILVADDETIQVFDLRDEKWSATLRAGFGGIKNVEFGRNSDEVLVFSDYQLKVTVWSLRTGKQVEIANPKFVGKGYGHRPCTSHFALLTRPLNNDVVTIRCHTSYKQVATFNLPTIDAQGLKWSPCGRWMVIWDSPALGYKVLIYTADGHLFRTFEKPCDGLGVKTVEWSPGSEFLAIGSYDGRISFLSTYTFSPVIEMNHTSTIRLPGISVWSECATAAKERHYLALPQPLSLPTIQPSASDILPKLGISMIAFNEDCTLVATRNDSMPTTVWIWSLKLLRPYAILVHLNPVKSISWHPTVPDMLLLTCSPESQPGGTSAAEKPAGSVYLWCSSWSQPRVVNTPLERVTGNTVAKWVVRANRGSSDAGVNQSRSRNSMDGFSSSSSGSSEREAEKRPQLIFGHKDGFVIGHVDEEKIIPEEQLPRSPAIESDDPMSKSTRPWNPKDWSYFSPTQSDRRTTNNSTTSSTDPKSLDIDDTFDYRAPRRITMKS